MANTGGSCALLELGTEETHSAKQWKNSTFCGSVAKKAHRIREEKTPLPSTDLS